MILSVSRPKYFYPLFLKIKDHYGFIVFCLLVDKKISQCVGAVGDAYSILLYRRSWTSGTAASIIR